MAQASDPKRLAVLLGDGDEQVRAWAVRLLVDLGETTKPAFVALAEREPSARVRLTLASALQKIPLAARAAVAAGLLNHGEDANDHNLPLMLWYGIEPLAAAPAGRFEQLIAGARIPRVQRLGARRLAEEIDSAPARLDTLLVALAASGSLESRRAVLDGIAAALSGRRKAPRPAAWPIVLEKFAAGADEALRNRLRDLSALFGDGRALEQIRAVALDASADSAQRRAALQALIDAQAPGLRENILFPSAIVPAEYRHTTLTMKDGRVLAGVVHGRTERTLKLQSISETLSIDIRDIAKEERSSLSLMPEGLLEAVGDEAARDLIAYLMAKDFSPPK